MRLNRPEMESVGFRISNTSEDSFHSKRELTMKILESIRQKISFIGYLTDEGIFRNTFYHAIVSVVLILIVFTFQLTAAIYVLRHLQIGDIENSLYAGLDVPATSMLIGTLLTILYNKKKVREVIDNFQNIFDKCKDRDAIHCL